MSAVCSGFTTSLLKIVATIDRYSTELVRGELFRVSNYAILLSRETIHLRLTAWSETDLTEKEWEGRRGGDAD